MEWCFFRRVVKIGGHGAASDKTRYAKPANCSFGAPRNHDVRIAALYQPRCVPNGMCARSAGRDNAVIWAFKFIANRDLPRREVNQHGGHNKGAKAARAFFFKGNRRIIGSF